MYGGSSRVSASVDNVDPSGHKGGKDDTVPLLGGITKAALNSRVWQKRRGKMQETIKMEEDMSWLVMQHSMDSTTLGIIMI